jgi:large conductance mechanosensitive channel
MLKDFKAFIARGNVLDLAIAVIMAGAFGKVVTTFTEKIIMPIVGFLTGGIDFTKMFIDLSGKYKGVTDPKILDEAIKGGAPLIMYGQFITDIINFLIVAFIMFLLARWFLKFFARFVAAAAPAAPTHSEELLTEIRDLMKAKQ